MEIFGSWSDAFDDRFGIYNVEDGLPVPYYIKHSLYYLILAWAALYFLIALISSLYIGAYTGEGCPRVAVAFGCLYRGIDRWYHVIPRMTTCTYLHYTTMHILMNSYSIGGSYALLTNSPTVGSQIWLHYWVIPVWYVSSLVGSLVTYFGHLRKVSSFSVGASGGACGFSVFSTILVFTLAPENLSGARRDSQIMSLVQTLVMVGLQSSPLATLGSGKKVDWMAHLGGSLMGAVMAMLCQYLVLNWDEPSLLRLGSLLTVITIGIGIACFFCILLQFCNGNEERVIKCYIQWSELDKIELDKAQCSQRRWTLGQNQMIERVINKKPRDPRRPLTPSQRAEEEEWLDWRAHKNDAEILYFDTRGTI